MSGKRYFFVHLVIFAGLCTIFTVAGVSSYREFLKTESGAGFASKEDPSTSPTPPAEIRKGREVPFLALTAITETQ